jgi:hypothetical protein
VHLRRAQYSHPSNRGRRSIEDAARPVSGPGAAFMIVANFAQTMAEFPARRCDK